MTKTKKLMQLATPTNDQDAYRALQESRFVPFFQPLVTLRTGQLEGFEVLARWQHPTRGVIPPSEFIAIAEQDGWIGALTQQILGKAFAAAALIPAPLTLAINISPFQLRDSHLPKLIHQIATGVNFSLSRLVVEITESALIDNLQSAATIISALKAMGCKLALDDFGTGYSSLHHLQSLPFDELKVDRSFVSSMTEKRESRKIVSAVVGLGQSLGLATVAEGIETQEQAEMMLWLGCQSGQGYFYGRPLPAHELAASTSGHRGRLVTDDRSAWKGAFATNLEVSPSQRLAQLQAIYGGAPVGLAFVDQNLRYVNLNKKLADMNGAPIENHLGSQVSEMIPELFSVVEPYLRRALGGEAISDVEAKLPTTGETRLLSCEPALDEAGEVIGVAIAVTDITERKRTEDALKASESHYRNMVDLNPQVLWIMDPQGRNLDVSPRWDKATGLMKVSSTDHRWLKNVHPEDMRATVRAIAVSRRKGSPIDVTYRVAEGEDGWAWKRAKGAPRFDVSGSIVCWYGSVQDVDAPIRPGRPIYKTGPSVNVETRIHVADLSLASIGDRRNQALRELEILDTLPESEFDDLVVLASEVCGTPISLMSLIDSEREWFKAAVGLAASETSIAVSFCAHAIEEQGLFVVPDATKDERFKQNPLVLGSPHVRFYAGMPLYAGDGVAIGTLCVIDTLPRTLSPGQVKALAILSYQVQVRLELRSERRKNVMELSTKRELTARLEVSNETLTRANQKLEQLFAELEQTRLLHLADECELRKRLELDNLKNEYVAMVSHELRSPLTSVRGAVGILSAGLVSPETDRVGRLFHIALSNLDRMIRLVNDVLNLERIASGTSSLLEIKRCSIEELVKQAIDTMLPVAQAANVKLKTTGMNGRTRRPLFFEGDADKTVQVLINLLSNAIKFSPLGGEVLVDIKATGDQLKVRISDEGRGIPEDQLEKVFDRFRQVEQDDARRLGGTGLGLAICRAIVKQHGGAIWAEINTVRGTSFFVTLPRSPRIISNAKNVKCEVRHVACSSSSVQ